MHGTKVEFCNPGGSGSSTTGGRILDVLVPQPYPVTQPQSLTSWDLNGVLRVLEDCERVSSVEELRMTALEGLGRHLGYRNTTFFAGDTLQSCLQDQSAVLNGRVSHLLQPYLERWHEHDLFFQPAAIRLISEYDVASLDWFPRPRRSDLRGYLDNFLFANRMHAKVVIRLRSSRTTAAVGLLDPESGAFGPRDLAIGRLLARHLGGLMDLNLKRETRAPIAALSPRQAEVVNLVASGLTNIEIAQKLFIGVDTVKKHITQALAVMGCRNRTQLALLWLSGREGS
ncbi:helix-turn-helix transcriptional regulator [Nocardia sputorum]|uniref:helix-turn-helix transcriptional regulator n=1 Tax=Nocardia sputorum TaxID=2984338 RepID=UPI002492D22F|nr:helix-turn-helix transcriptional regulator [Nocardia sputorum]